MVTIVPAILVKTEKEFKEKLAKVWGLVNWVQLDVIDGVFFENKTVGPEVLKSVDTQVKFSVQLMVDEPAKWVERCSRAGVSRVMGHVKMMADRTAFVADAQAEEMKVGLAYDIDTSLDGLEEVVADLDAVLLMSVKAGRGGQKFDERVLSKIKQVRKLSKKVEIVVDGGLDEESIKKCIEAEWEEEMEEDEFSRSVSGMEFVVGMHLLGADNVKKELLRLQRLKVHG